MKKLITLFMTMLMVLSLSACGSNDKPVETPNDSINDDTVVTTPVEDEPVETPEEPEETGPIEIVFGETYTVENWCDITFNEMYRDNRDLYIPVTAKAYEIGGDCITHPTKCKIYEVEDSEVIEDGMYIVGYLLDEYRTVDSPAFVNGETYDRTFHFVGNDGLLSEVVTQRYEAETIQIQILIQDQLFTITTDWDAIPVIPTE